MNESTPLLRTAQTYARDLAERVIATFVVAAGALFVAAEPADMLTLSFWEGAAVAGLASVGSLLKGLFARLTGDPNSASTSPGV